MDVISQGWKGLRSARRRLGQLLLVLVVCGPTGCATDGQGALFTQLGRPPDPYCSAEFQKLDSYDNQFGKSLVAGAVAGLATGLATDSVEAGIITAIVVTLAANYLMSLEQQEEAARRDIYLSDVRGENQAIDGATRAFNELSDCRFAAARKVKADYRAGRLSEAEAEQEMQQLRTLWDFDLKLARKIQVRINERGGQFAEASALVGGPGAQEQPAVATAPAATPTPAPVPAAGEPRETYKWSNVRSGPGTSNARIERLAPRTRVDFLGPAASNPGWSRIRLADGREGYIARSLLVEPGAAAPEERAEPAPAPQPAAPEGSDATVTQVTRSNQVKRQAFASEVTMASNSAGSVFNLGDEEQLGFRQAPEALGHS